MTQNDVPVDGSDYPAHAADRLNEIGVLTRREIEARLLAPMLEAFSDQFGREAVMAVAGQVIQSIAYQQGVELAASLGGNTLVHYAASMGAWQKGSALEIETLEQTDERLAYNVTHCAYAEMYRNLGIAHLGRLLSCSRDLALIQGFNPQITLTRTQTIMEGAPVCDFCFKAKKQGE